MVSPRSVSEEAEDGFVPAPAAGVGSANDAFETGFEIFARGPGNDDGNVDRGQELEVVGTVADTDGLGPLGREDWCQPPYRHAFVLAGGDEVVETPAAGDLESVRAGRRFELAELALVGHDEGLGVFAPGGALGVLGLEPGEPGDFFELHVAKTAEAESFGHAGEEGPGLGPGLAQDDHPESPGRFALGGAEAGRQVDGGAVFDHEGFVEAELVLEGLDLGPGLGGHEHEGNLLSPQPLESRPRGVEGVGVVVEKRPVEVGEDDPPHRSGANIPSACKAQPTQVIRWRSSGRGCVILVPIMGVIDLAIVVASLLGLVVFAGWLARRQRDSTDYYLGGRHLPAWSLGLSLAANQVSAISLVGAPAFVALRDGGGLVWLQYELAVPLALAALVVWGVPVLRRAPGADVYAGVEARLGKAARRTLAAFFLLGRGLGSGVILYTSALVVDAVSGWGLAASLWVVGLVAVAYTGLGGLVADVVSDVLQLGLLWGGTLVATVYLAITLGAEGELWSGLDRSRLAALDFAGHGLGDGATFAFWPMLFGGLFLYLSYYGCDQTQAQRILAAPDDGAARRALTVAALVRFPLVLTYCFFGVLLMALLAADPQFAAGLEGRPPDALVPHFMVSFLPVGLLGLAVAGILAAALSSIDSALNSLSAVTLEEFFPRTAASGGRAALLAGRSATVAWGVWAVATGFYFATAGETVIELVNRVGSLVYGPILALFLLAWRSRRADGRSAVAGAAVGVGLNLFLAWGAPGISWLWWNVFGCAAALLVGELAGRHRHAKAFLSESEPSAGRSSARVLLVAFAVIFAGLALLTAAV